VEETHTLVTFDIECLNLNADYGTMLCFSWMPYGKTVQTIAVSQPGDDKKLAIGAKNILEAADCWLSFNGKMFDIKYLNSRLLYHGIPPVTKKHHLDLYLQLKPKLRATRKGLGPLAGWLKLEEGKMGVSQSVWSEAPANWKENKAILVERCESDVRVLEKMYKRTRDFVGEVTR
jgi:uncharacterized protein YprB with RNaseH-like and TPR domain